MAASGAVEICTGMELIGRAVETNRWVCGALDTQSIDAQRKTHK
nr:MAG TPA: hypothetical protein [Caudoviricetes sp.]